MTKLRESRETYFKKMFGDKTPKPCKIKSALNRAHDIRKFEIDLYWRRSNQMYVIVAALATAVGLLLTPEKGQHPYYLGALFISILGAFISFAWVHVNKGSSFWQENWESHIDVLEDCIDGKLYKYVNTQQYDRKGYSVSKINLCISWIIFWSWVVMIGYIVKVQFNSYISGQVHFVWFDIVIDSTLVYIWSVIVFIGYLWYSRKIKFRASPWRSGKYWKKNNEAYSTFKFRERTYDVE